MTKPKKITKSMFLTLAGAAILLLQALGFKIDLPYADKIINALCAVLIFLGVVTAPKKDSPQEDKATEQTSVQTDEQTNEQISEQTDAQTNAQSKSQ